MMPPKDRPGRRDSVPVRRNNPDARARDLIASGREFSPAARREPRPPAPSWQIFLQDVEAQRQPRPAPAPGAGRPVASEAAKAPPPAAAAQRWAAAAGEDRNAPGTKVRVNDFLTRYMLPELAEFLGMKFAHPDRLSRAEARAVIDTAKRNPDVAAALRDAGHRAHPMVRLYKDVVEHYAFRHPADAGGAPEPWPVRPASTHRPTGSDPFAGMSRDEAEARLTYGLAHPELRAALTDPKHPEHNVCAAQVAALGQIQAEGAASPDAGAPIVRPAGDGAQQVNALQADQAFMAAYTNKSHAGHAAAVERMAAAYRAAYPEPVEVPAGERLGADRGKHFVAAEHRTQQQASADTLRSTPGIRQDGKVHEVEMARLRADPAYANHRDPRHAEVMAAVTAAYQAAYPAPPPGEGAAASTAD